MQTVGSPHRTFAWKPPIRVALLGARGRVGTEICRALTAAPDLELVAEVGRGDSLDALLTRDAEVAVDFTEPEAAAEHLSFLIAHGIHGVVGTTGISQAVIQGVEAQVSGYTRCVCPGFCPIRKRCSETPVRCSPFATTRSTELPSHLS